MQILQTTNQKIVKDGTIDFMYFNFSRVFSQFLQDLNKLSGVVDFLVFIQVFLEKKAPNIPNSTNIK